MKKIIWPNGRVENWVFDSNAVEVQDRDNLLKITTGGQATILDTTYDSSDRVILQKNEGDTFTAEPGLYADDLSRLIQAVATSTR